MKITSITLAFLLLFGLSVQITAQGPTYPVGQGHDLPRGERALVRALDISATAAALIREVMESNKGIPQYILDNAEAIAVFPSDPEVKPLFGKDTNVGIVSLRDQVSGVWGAPIFLIVDHGTIEDYVQDGKDYIILAMDKGLADSFLKYDFKLAVARGGTFGNVVEPGAKPADIDHGFLSYIRDRKCLCEFGAFAGSPVYGSKIRQYCELNQAVYGVKELDRYMPVAQIVNTRALLFTDTLNKYVRKVGA